VPFDCRFLFARKFPAVARKEFDAVVAGRVVGRAHHDAEVRARFAGDKRDARGGHHPQVDDIAPRGKRAFRKSAGEILPAGAGVPAHDDRAFPRENSQGIADEHRKPVGEFLAVNAPYSVRAETHGCALFVLHSAVYSRGRSAVTQTACKIF